MWWRSRRASEFILRRECSIEHYGTSFLVAVSASLKCFYLLGNSFCFMLVVQFGPFLSSVSPHLPRLTPLHFFTFFSQSLSGDRIASQHSSESLCKRPGLTQSLFRGRMSLLNLLFSFFCRWNQCIFEGQHSVMLLLLQLILLSPWFSMKLL